MKALVTKEKRSLPAVRKPHSYVHYPLGPVQQADQNALRKILRPDELFAKPDIGENDGKYEQEADHAVAGLPVSAISGLPPGGTGGIVPVQRSENGEPEEELHRQSEEEEEPIQTKLIQRQTANLEGSRLPRFGYVGSEEKVQQVEISRILRSTGVRAKLTVGQPNDKYEQEADRVADQVMRMPEPKFQRQPENEEEEEILQTKPLTDQITPLVQRQVGLLDEEEAPVQAKLLHRQPENEEEEELQTKSKTVKTPAVTPCLESRINSLKGGGQPLDPSARSFFEPRFGKDLSPVRIHTDSRAAETAKDINARAFTVGNHVAIGEGMCQLNSRDGRHLMGHELTHVMQQKGDTFNSVESSIVQRQDEEEGTKQPKQKKDEESEKAKGERQRLKKEVTVLKRKVALLQRQASINAILTEFRSELNDKKEEWIGAAESVGSAYAIATKNHIDAIADQEKFDALVQAVLFGLLTAAVAGGALGGLGELMSHGKNFTKGQTALRGAIEDAIQTGGGEAVDVWQSQVGKKPPKISEIPLVFQNDIKKAIRAGFKTLRSDVKSMIKKVGKIEIEDSEMTGWIGVDPEELKGNIKQWWAEFEFNDSPKTLDSEEMNKAMERNMWAKWMPALHKRVEKSLPLDDYGKRRQRYTVDEYEGPGEYIERRFNSLDITKEAGVKDYGTFWTSDSEIKKLIGWAKSHKTEDLGMPASGRK